MSEVQIHVPSHNETNQARWNMMSTFHLVKWFEARWYGDELNTQPLATLKHSLPSPVVEKVVANPLFPHQQTTGNFQTKF